MFPTPDDLEFQVENLLAEAAATTDAAGHAGISDLATNAARSVYDSFLVWPSQRGMTIVTACFWNGTLDAQQAIANSDRAWEQIANFSINFKKPNGDLNICLDTSSANIRISLKWIG